MGQNNNVFILLKHQKFMNLKARLTAYALAVPLLFAGCDKKEAPTKPAVNHSPTIERIVASETEPFTDQEISLECRATDEDNDILVYDWRCDGGYFDNITQRTTKWHSPNEVKEYHITVKIDDNKGGTASRTTLLNVLSRLDTLYVTDDAYTFSGSPDLNTNREHYFFPYLIEVYSSQNGGSENIEDIYLKFPQINKEVRSINLKLTRSSDGDPEKLRCYIFEISEGWGENVITYRNRPSCNELPKKAITFPIINVNQSLYIDITDVNLEYGIMISPIEEGTSRSFYSKEGAQREGNTDYTPALIVEYE